MNATWASHIEQLEAKNDELERELKLYKALLTSTTKALAAASVSLENAQSHPSTLRAS